MKFKLPLRRFGRDRKGLAALEFAIIAPMMVFLLFASVDLIDMLGANRRSQNVAASLADVIARDNAVSNAEIASLWSAINVLMYPNNSNGLQIRISSVSITASGPQVVWSEGHGGMTAYAPNTRVTLPPQMNQVGSSVIMAEMIYPYAPPLGFLPSTSMQHEAYRRSRLVDPIPRVS